MCQMPSSHYRSLSDLEKTYWWHVSRLNHSEKIIRKYFPTPSSLNVVDYGCGTGGFIHSLNERIGFKSWRGVDTSPTAIEMARKYGDNYALCAPDDFSHARGADLLLLMDVLEHVQDDERFLGELIRGGGKHAKILLSVPALPLLFSSWDQVLGHHRRYTKKSMINLVKRAGGGVTHMEYCFSYLVPMILFRRILLNGEYDHDKCEFPPVSGAMNKFLILLNGLEMFASGYLPSPFGSSLFCLIEPNE